MFSNIKLVIGIHHTEVKWAHEQPQSTLWLMICITTRTQKLYPNHRNKQKFICSGCNSNYQTAGFPSYLSQFNPLIKLDINLKVSMVSTEIICPQPM